MLQCADSVSRCPSRSCSLSLSISTGFGGIAQATVKLLAPFGMKQMIAFDPYCKPEVAAAFGVKLVSLDELCEQADFVSVHCPLNDGTRGLIGKAQFDKMKDG